MVEKIMLDSNEKELKIRKWHKSDSGLFLPDTYLAKVKKKTLKERIRWVIDNITIVLLLPSFLGAVWQILELSSMNIAYIRFFSISQIPVDGTLILFLGLLLLAMGKIIITFVKFDFETKAKQYKDENLLAEIKSKLNKLIIKHTITLMILLAGLAYLIPNIFIDMFADSPIFTIVLMGGAVMAVMLYAADTLVLVSLKIISGNHDIDNIEKTIRSSLDKYKYLILFSVVSITILTSITLIILLKLFSQNFILPTNLYNTKDLDLVINKEFKTKDYSIEYFNDKYIFVELCTIKKCSHALDKEIVIYPTEKVLFKTTYGKVWSGYFTTYNPVDNNESP